MVGITISIIKIKGTYDKKKWNEKNLKEYVKTKILKEIDRIYHTDLELFSAKNGNIDVWVFISTMEEKSTIEKWLKNHIKE